MKNILAVARVLLLFPLFTLCGIRASAQAVPSLESIQSQAELDKAIADLKPNEISQPFKTRYGWHIVQMLGTRTYDSTDDVRRQRAYAAIRESKADEETELWLRRLRDEAFVEIKM